MFLEGVPFQDPDGLVDVVDDVVERSRAVVELRVAEVIWMFGHRGSIHTSMGKDKGGGDKR